jgi:1-acyl-sn-glycerol-3-phosphate acyltransferase
MAHARSLRTILLIAAHLATGTAIATYIALLSRLGRRPDWISAVTRRWYRRLCVILGLRIRVEGRLDPGCLLIGNHVSWLDIPALGAQGEFGFLSKSEVRDWPLIGWLAETAGTHFIERGANRIDEISAMLRCRIAQGHTLMIFPEGTTSDGTGVLRFHPRLFELARDARLEIQPVAIAYRRAADGQLDTVAPFIGDDTLLAHLLRVIRHPGLMVEIRFLPPLPSGEEASRRALAERTRGAILDALGMEPQAGPARSKHPRPGPIPYPAQPESMPAAGVPHVA